MRDFTETETGIVKVDKGLCAGFDDRGRERSRTGSKVGDFLSGGHGWKNERVARDGGMKIEAGFGFGGAIA